MQIELLNEFVTVVDCRSFTAASDRLHITQPALSRHVSTLERELRCKLLIRDTHHVEPTPEGQIAYREFVRIVNIYANACQVLGAAGEPGIERLRVGVPYYCMNYMDTIRDQLLADYPLVSLEVRSFQPTPAYRALQADEIDVALLFHHEYPDSHDIVFHNFAVQRLVFLVAEEHPLSCAETARIEQVADNALVLPRNNCFSGFVQDLIGNAGHQPQGIIYTDSIDTVPYDLRGGDRVSIQPECVRNMSREHLAFIPLEGDMFVPFAIAYNRDNTNPAISMLVKAAARAFA